MDGVHQACWSRRAEFICLNQFAFIGSSWRNVYIVLRIKAVALFFLLTILFETDHSIPEHRTRIQVKSSAYVNLVSLCNFSSKLVSGCAFENLISISNFKPISPVNLFNLVFGQIFVLRENKTLSKLNV